ncbi:MAG: FAD-dependent oxidoreductase [Alphaproteobacteria bacterium]|nr:FAD-dependent oxidoreductase [Alphaproteobacteria bacterium]
MAGKAAIVGGSVGGLFAAHALRNIGWEIAVYERAEGDLAARGAGLGTHQDLFEIMQRLGIAVDERTGIAVGSRVCLARSGDVLKEIPFQERKSSWATIWRALRRALPDDCFNQGKDFAALETGANGAVAHFADGTTVTADLLVGADGNRSTVRERLLPQVQPRYCGYVAWRALIPENGARLYDRYAFSMPDGGSAVSYPVPGRDGDIVPGRRSINFLWYHPASEAEVRDMSTDETGHCHGMAIPPPLIRKDVVANLLREAADQLPPQHLDLLRAEPQPFFQAIYDLECDRLAFGRAVLLGDAAFVARPHVGAGVTKAALDTHGLADALRAHGDDIASALASYERERLKIGKRMVARARRLGAFIEFHRSPDFKRPDTMQQADELLYEHGADIRSVAEFWA